MLLAINGDLGSGKSELAKRLSEATGWRIVSMGAIQRSVAERLGISTLEMNRRAETDPQMDELLRQEVEKLALASDDIIIDSRLAFHFLPEALSLHLIAHPRIAAERVMQTERGTVEAYADVNDAHAQLIARRSAERSRYLAKFGVRMERLDNYDLVVQTDLVTPHDVFVAVTGWLQAPARKGDGRKMLLNPRSLLPASSDGIDLHLDQRGVSIIRVGDMSYIASGVEEALAACRADQAFIGAALHAQEDSVDRAATGGLVDLSAMKQRREAWEGRTGSALDPRLSL